MKSRQKLALPASRWGAYATAATALVAGPAVEGSIHYSGPIHFVFDGENQHHSFPLEDEATLVFEFSGSADDYYNLAAFKLKGAAVSSQFRGFQSAGPVSFIGRLRAGARVSAGRFFPVRTNRYAYFSTYRAQGYWHDAGVGFVGFEFNNGGGKQYGWARVRTRGAPSYAFVVEGYAWGDPGDVIRAGQTESDPAAPVPAAGSLGMLALGGAGLAAWRRARNQSAR